MPITPNMNLDLPTVSTTAGPAWATAINSALGVAGDGIDGHDHTNGKGVPIPPSGLDITSALTFQNQDATNLRSTRFYPQTDAFNAATDVGCCYVLDADLYYIDTAGNSIRITENGAISSASFGGITGLAAPASAAFSVDTFTFKSSATEYALLDSGPLRTRPDGEASPGYIEIGAPAGLTSGQSYALTLPAALPASTSFQTVSAAGAIATSISTSGGITKPMQAAVGQQVSAVATQTVTSTSWTNVTNAVITNMSVTGRPVVLTCIADPALGTGDGAYFQSGVTYTDNGGAFGGTSSSSIGVRVSITGDATTTVGQNLLSQQWSSAAGLSIPINENVAFAPSILSTVYVPAGAGTFTFQLQIKADGNPLGSSCRNIRLLAFEL